jgi:hypothetical protein
MVGYGQSTQLASPLSPTSMDHTSVNVGGEPDQVITHSLGHSLNHSHTHSLQCRHSSLTHSLTRSLTHSPTHSLARSLSHSLTQVLIRIVGDGRSFNHRTSYTPYVHLLVHHVPAMLASSSGSAAQGEYSAHALERRNSNAAHG